MTDVVLLTMPPNFNFTLRVQPQGVLHIASTLEEQGIDVKILDLTIDYLSKEKVMQILSKENPSIIGITAFSNHIRDAVVYANYFKENDIDAKIVLGGPHVTLCPDFVKKFKMFDHGFVGEGEITFPKMVKSIMQGKKEKRVVRGKVVKDLDALPLPAYHLLEMKKYKLPHISMRFSTALVSRGCPYSCDFCNVPKLSGRLVRFKSVKKIVEEIKILKEEYKVGSILFTDENFTLDERRTIELCKTMIKEGIDLKWLCETRCDLVNRRLLKIMHRAGCRTIGFGVESGSEKIRQQIKSRTVSNNVVNQAFKLCNEIGIKSAAFLIFGHPNDTMEDIKKTFDYPLKLNADFIYPNPNFLLPATSVFENSVREGKIKKDIWEKYASGEIKHVPILAPNGLTDKDIMRMIIRMDALFYLRPYTIVSRLKKIKSFDDFATLVRASRDILLHSVKSDYIVKRFFHAYFYEK